MTLNEYLYQERKLLRELYREEYPFKGYPSNTSDMIRSLSPESINKLMAWYKAINKELTGGNNDNQ